MPKGVYVRDPQRAAARKAARLQWHRHSPGHFSVKAPKAIGFSWWAHFETPPGLFYETAAARATELNPIVTRPGGEA